METTAKAKFIRITPKKVRLVANLIKGLDVEEALIQLQFVNKASSASLIKLLKSAIANVEENHKLKRNNLFIREIRIDEGPIMYRWLPRAFGRATPKRKRASHITLILAERVPTLKKESTKIESAEKNKKEENKKTDLIPVEALSDLKDFDDLGGKETKEGRGLAAKSKDISLSKSKKGFVSKIFNRKSG